MSKNKMKDVIVLLPGITGSVLKKNGKKVWGYSPSILFGSVFTRGNSIQKDLALPHDDPETDDLGDGIAADSLIPDLHLLPGIWKIDGYSEIANAIINNFDVTEGKNFFRFPYDWRRDNRVAARMLQRSAHTWLKDWRESSGNEDARLILLAHSMGGIVCRYFLECMEGWKVTRSLITFGTPFRGSVNSLDGLSNGMKKGPLNWIDLSDMIRQFTSMYQLLPRYPCYDNGDGILKRVGETTGIPNVDPVMSEAALKFHIEIENSVSSNQKIPKYQESVYSIYPVVGRVQETNESAKLDGGKVVMLNSYEGITIGGDGTVPRVSATPIELGDEPKNVMYAGTKHGSLQNSDSVIQHLLGVLSGFDLKLSTFKKSKTPVSLKIEDVFLISEPITLQVRPRVVVSDVDMKVELWNSKEKTPVDKKQLRIKDDDWHTIEFAPPGHPGEYRVSVSGSVVETAEDSFAVLDVAE